MTEHKKNPSDFEKGASDGPLTDRAPGEEELSDEQVMDRHERKD